MNSGPNKIRSVEWDEVCPWLILFRTFRIAASARCLVLATVGVVITMLITWGFLPAPDGAHPCPMIRQVESLPSHPAEILPAFLPPRPVEPPSFHPEDGANESPPETLAESPLEAPPVVRPPRGVIPGGISKSVFGIWQSLTRPFAPVFDSSATWGEATGSLVAGLLILATWAFFGAAITRTAALRLTLDERAGWGRMFQFCCTQWIHYFFAPLCPLIPILVFALVMLPAGWLMRLGIGTILVGILWPLILLGGMAGAFLLLGVLFGWPLMWATISTEGTDGFDAMSRTYSYVYQRPLRYLFYAVVASLFGLLCFAFVLLFTSLILGISTWAVSWGAGESLVAAMSTGETSDLSTLQRVGIGIHQFWTVGVKTVALSFAYSYFWVATSAVYLLLRRDTDAKEMDEVFLEEGVSQVAAGLPNLTLDEAGAPIIEDKTPSAEGETHRPPKVRHRPPKAKHRPPKARYRPPKARYRPPKARYRPPKARYRPPRARHDPSRTKWGPSKRDRPPVRRNQIRKTSQTTQRNNKWND